MRIDRVGAYAARYAAKNIVAAGLADECEVMISYASGFSRPIAVVKQFQLRRLVSMNPLGFYQHLAAYGHFGRDDMQIPWEQTDKASQLKKTGKSM